MFKIAGRVLDFYDDPSFSTNVKAQELFGTKLVPLEKAASLPDSAFAVKISTENGDVRKWPIYNKTATALSGAYFSDVMDSLPENLRNAAGYLLKQAFVKQGMKLPSKLNEPFPRTESDCVKLAEDSSRMLAPDTKGLVEFAQERFIGEMSGLSPEDRFSQANELFTLCKKAGVEVDARVWQYVEKDHSGPYLKEEIEARHLLVKSANETMGEAFLSTLAEMKGVGLKKFAEALRAFDRMSGMDEKYDNGLRDPFLAIYGGMMEKEADRAGDITDWKLKSLVMKGKELSRIFEPTFVNRFLNDPAGTLKTAGPLEKRILSYLLEKIPSPPLGAIKSDLLTKFDQGGPKKVDFPLRGTVKSVATDIGGRDGLSCL